MRDAYEHTDYLYDENHYIDMWLKNLGTSPVKNKSDWNEERMDNIGRNGNDGLHYQYNSVEYYPPGYTAPEDDGKWYGDITYKPFGYTSKDEPKSQQFTSSFPPGHTPRDIDDKVFLDKLINDHWKYIEGVLDKAGMYQSELAQIEYHYKTAFAHGWKHAVEYYNADNT